VSEVLWWALAAIAVCLAAVTVWALRDALRMRRDDDPKNRR